MIEKIEKTLSIIKPDGVKKNIIGQIYSKIESSGLKIINIKMCKLSKKQAQNFYFIHKDKPFFDSLTSFMSSGKIVVQILEGINAIHKYRNVMGNTDPQKAIPGSIRRVFSDSIDENIVHGSDSLKSAEQEISFFFSKREILMSQD